ncbi:DUF1876 domain-containing protein [Streptomyces cavernicola]|uniref:DUF1876 domain-containing protein n=1 Tax=Streptomyces cavernicola TaxID=3043613 RepID=A0ABT6SF97_9ACTN|nr:DUF1876 domain-containing protein [Streptomyces sp. B-S-A6]MDI3406858.1 DUF1876 domain-containing protein [Streptomyces sp. B-S-A6]
MKHTAEWDVRLYLSEEDGTTRTHAVLNTGTSTLDGHGTAQCNPADSDVPEIGDELSASRALQDLGRRLMATAYDDMEAVGAAGTDSTRRDPR